MQIEVLWVGAISAFIVGIFSVITLLVQARIAESQQRALFARQDEVARRAREDADRLIKATGRTTTAVENSAGVTLAKLNEIAKVANITHSLVNSAYTTAKQQTLDALSALLVLMRREVAKDAMEGRPIDEEAAAAIDGVIEKVNALKQELADRAAALPEGDE